MSATSHPLSRNGPESLLALRLAEPRTVPGAFEPRPPRTMRSALGHHGDIVARGLPIAVHLSHLVRPPRCQVGSVGFGARTTGSGTVDRDRSGRRLHMGCRRGWHRRRSGHPGSASPRPRPRRMSAPIHGALVRKLPKVSGARWQGQRRRLEGRQRRSDQPERRLEADARFIHSDAAQ
jgi:hypothetical protein